MPLYEYQCESCAARFERIQKFSDPVADTCPKCGGPVKKLVSSPAIQFKGSGWYITDYAKKSSGDGGAAGSSESSAKDKTTESSAAGTSSTDASSTGTQPAGDSTSKTKTE